MDTIDFDLDKARKFVRAYEKAVAAGLERFTFDGHSLVVPYAKYVVEYLETRFGTLSSLGK